MILRVWTFKREGTTSAAMICSRFLVLGCTDRLFHGWSKEWRVLSMWKCHASKNDVTDITAGLAEVKNRCILRLVPSRCNHVACVKSRPGKSFCWRDTVITAVCK